MGLGSGVERFDVGGAAMDRVLVAYGSKYGSTAEIAEAIGRALRASGLDVDVEGARSVHSLEGYRAAVVGSAVYAAHWRGDALRLLGDHRDWLTQHDVWLFSSGPVGEDDEDADEAETERWTKPKKVQELAAEIGARDHVVFGGKVDEDRGFIRKRMARGMPDEVRDRRDWDEIAAWAAAIASVLASEPGPPAGSG
jgi:menaquinone-dependent protoporphyrinogen oxidase